LRGNVETGNASRQVGGDNGAGGGIHDRPLEGGLSEVWIIGAFQDDGLACFSSPARPGSSRGAGADLTAVRTPTSAISGEM